MEPDEKPDARLRAGCKAVVGKVRPEVLYSYGWYEARRWGCCSQDEPEGEVGIGEARSVAR